MTKKMKIEYVSVDKLKPYKQNPRKNDQAVEIVMKSIQEFGFKNPIIVDKDYEIIAGHTRLKAAIKLGYKEVPYIKVEDLTQAQVKAFRIMDNRSSEFAEWDYDLLKGEFNALEGEDAFDFTGFDSNEISEIWEEKKEKQKDNIGDTDKLGHLVIECPKCHHKFKKEEKN